MTQRFRPGAQVRMDGGVADAETGSPLPSITVELQRFDHTFGDFVTFRSVLSGSNGQFAAPLALPVAVGRYRYRTRVLETPNLEGDTSPPVEIEIVAP